MSHSSLRIIVLAAGKGTRMHSRLPKVYHPLGNKPMLAYVLDTAQSLAPEQVVTIISPSMQPLEEMTATKIQAEQQGTAHAVLAAKDCLESFDGNLLVLYGDTPLLTSETLHRLLDARKQSPAPSIVVLGMRPDNPTGYGRIVVEGAEVTAIVEQLDATPAQLQNDLCNSGVMLIDGKIALELLQQIKCDNAKNEYYLTDIVGIAKNQGLGVGYIEAEAEELLGINSKQELAAAEAKLQNTWRQQALDRGVTLTDPSTVYFSHDTEIKSDVTIGPNVVFGSKVAIEEGVTIQPFCKIAGATIQSGATIGPFAHIRPDTAVGPNAKIGNFVELKKSTIEDGAKINHLSYIGDSTVGAQSNIGAGTITCNYDGFNKHKTIIGERVSVGANTSLVAPVTVGDDAMIAAGSVITADVAAEAIALSRTPQKVVDNGATRFKRKRSQQK